MCPLDILRDMTVEKCIKIECDKIDNKLNITFMEGEYKSSVKL